jgi:hypothetical protein
MYGSLQSYEGPNDVIESLPPECQLCERMGNCSGLDCDRDDPPLASKLGPPCYVHNVFIIIHFVRNSPMSFLTLW